MSAARHRAWAGLSLTLVTTLGAAVGCGGGKSKPPVAAADQSQIPQAALVQDDTVAKAPPRDAEPTRTPTTRPSVSEAPGSIASAPTVDSLAREVARLRLELDRQTRKPDATTPSAKSFLLPKGGPAGDEARPAEPGREKVPAPVAKAEPPAVHESVAATAEKSVQTDPPVAAKGAAGANAVMSVDDWAKAMEIEPSGGTATAKAGATRPSATTAPADATARSAEQRIRDNPRDVAAHLEYQLAKFLRNEPVPDLAAMAKLPQEDRDILTALLDGLSNFRSGLKADDNLLLSEKLRPLMDLSTRLRTQAELAIPTVALCTEVRGFGVYTPIEPARFESSRPGPQGKGVVGPQFVIYCEIQNLASRQSPDGRWESTFTQESVLYTDQGVPVWTSERIPMKDQARNRRQDFYSAARVSLPAGQLPVGRYVLKVSIEDGVSNRVAEATTPVDIVTRLAQPVAADRQAAQPAGSREGQAARNKEVTGAAAGRGLFPFPMIAPAPEAATPSLTTPSRN